MLGDQFETLNADVLEISTRVRDDDSQTNRRALIHAMSAYIEGCTYGLRQTTTEIDNDQRVLTEGERYILSETAFRLDGKGKVKDTPAYQRLEQMLLFSFRTFAQVRGAMTYSPDTSDYRWDSVQKFIKLRNRVTHPKSAADLICEDSDVDVVLSAFDWFHDTIRDIARELKLVDGPGA